MFQGSGAGELLTIFLLTYRSELSKLNMDMIRWKTITSGSK